MKEIPPFPVGRKLKLLRVAPDASGELHTFRDAADLDPESYWFDLLHDPRGRVPNGPGYWRTLAARRGQTLTLSCEKCMASRQVHAIDELVMRFGGDMRIDEVVARLANCSKHAKRCRLTYFIPPEFS